MHNVVLDRTEPHFSSITVDGVEVCADGLLTADDVFECLLDFDPDGEWKLSILDSEEEDDDDSEEEDELL